MLVTVSSETLEEAENHMFSSFWFIDIFSYGNRQHTKKH